MLTTRYLVFAVRVSQGGTKTFTLAYGSPRKRVTLGRFGIITLAQARDKARQLLAHRTLHGDRRRRSPLRRR